MPCGMWAMWHPTEGHTRWFCGGGGCRRPECANLFWSRRVRLITALIEEYRLSRFFTLTLDPDMVKGNPWAYIRLPWTKFRHRMKRRFNSGFKYVAVLESHKNRDCPHIHGFTNVWMEQTTWSDLWHACCGGSVVWVEQVKSPDLSRYVSKSIEVARYVGKEQLKSGYKHKANSHTLWRSTNTKARFELTKASGWCIVKENVYAEDGKLTDYWSKKGVWNYGTNEQQREDVEAARSPLLAFSTENRFAHMETQESTSEQDQVAVAAVTT